MLSVLNGNIHEGFDAQKGPIGSVQDNSNRVTIVHGAIESDGAVGTFSVFSESGDETIDDSIPPNPCRPTSMEVYTIRRFAPTLPEFKIKG